MSSRRRVFKIGERIQALVAQELLRLADPRFHMVTITSVAVASDLRTAKVYWVATGGADRIEEVEEAFEAAAGQFKRLLARELGIKFVPQLKFFYDDTLDVSNQVQGIFDRIAREREADEEKQHDS